MANLNAKHLLVRNKTTGVDPRVDNIIAGKEPETSIYQKCLITLKSEIKKGYFEACIIADRDNEKISQILEVPVEQVAMYRDFFYDVSEMDKLDLLDLVYQEENASSRNMKIWALSQGLDFIAWRLGKFVAINPVDGLKEMFTLCTYKAREAMFSSNASESSKEATKWAKLSMDLARLLKAWVMDSDSARKDIELALASIEPKFDSYNDLNEPLGVPGAKDPLGDITPGVLEDDFPGFPEN